MGQVKFLRLQEEEMAKRRVGKVVALVLVVSVGVVFSAGCFGKFQLTRNLYDINRSVKDKYLRSAATWLFVIPYALTGFLDFAVFNLIEFWSGENPIAAGPQARVYEKGDERAEMTIAREERRPSRPSGNIARVLSFPRSGFATTAPAP